MYQLGHALGAYVSGSCYTCPLAVMAMEFTCAVNLDIAVLHGLSVGAGFWDLSQQPLIGYAL